MTFGQLLHTFFADGKLKAVLVLIFLDFVLGSTAAYKAGNFRVAYIADLARNDILFKVVPWFVVYAGAVVAGNQDIIINGVTVATAAGALYVLVVGALGASIASSLLQLGLGGAVSGRLRTLLGPENASPPKD